MKVNRTEKHVITKSNIMWEELDNLCFKSKNLYNYANYIMRKSFIAKEGIIKYNDLTMQLKHSEPFKDLGSNSAQHTLKLLCRDWKSFMECLKRFNKNPKGFLGRPKLPNYKKKDGRHICILTNWQSQIKDGYLYFAFKPLKPFNHTIKTKIEGKHMQTRIIPSGGCYVLEIVYEIEVPEQSTESKNIASIDLGVNNFVTIANNIGAKSIIINGRGVKSYNQYWNKQASKYRTIAKTNNGLDWIKKSVLSSELNKLFNLEDINWLKCEEFALGNLVKKVCEYWNNKEEWETTGNLAKIFNLNYNTIARYLKKGNLLGWTKYDSSNEIVKVSKKNGEKLKERLSIPIYIFKDGKLLGEFRSSTELERQSEEIFGIKLNRNCVTNVAKGMQKAYKGYTFKYVESNG